MALAIDGSSPAVATGSPTATTLSFTPPAGSLLLIGYAGNTDNGTNPNSVPSITDNLGVHLTYSLIAWRQRGDGSPAVDGQAAMWTAPVGSSAAMTVSVTNNAQTSRDGELKVWVLTGQDTVTPVGASGKAASASAASIAQSYTAQATGGWGFITVSDWDQKGAETAGTGCTSDGSANTTGITYAFMRRTTADDTNGASNTLNVTLPATSTNLNWVYVEIKPAAVVAGTSPAPLTVSGVRRSAPAGSSLVLGSTAVSRDFQQPVDVVGAPPRAPGGIGSALVISSRAPSADAQPAARIFGATPCPPATGSALVIGSRAAPPPLTDTPPPPAVIAGIRPPSPAGTALVLGSEAPSLDAQPKPLQGLPGAAQVRVGSAVTLGSVTNPPPVILPVAVVVPAQRWPLSAGVTVLSRSPVSPLPAPAATPVGALVATAALGRRFAGPVGVWSMLAGPTGPVRDLELAVALPEWKWLTDDPGPKWAAAGPEPKWTSADPDLRARWAAGPPEGNWTAGPPKV